MLGSAAAVELAEMDAEADTMGKYLDVHEVVAF